MAIRMSRPAPARRPAGRSALCAALALLSVKGPITPSALYVPRTACRTIDPHGFASSTVWRPARSMRQQHEMERAAVVDFDVHHGNGTQAMFQAVRPLLCILSVPLYPGTGSASETGEHGNIVNAPLAPFRVPRSSRRNVDALSRHCGLSAGHHLHFYGFDAHAADPLAQLNPSKPTTPGSPQNCCRLPTTLHGRVVRPWKAATTLMPWQIASRRTSMY